MNACAGMLAGRIHVAQLASSKNRSGLDFENVRWGRLTVWLFAIQSNPFQRNAIQKRVGRSLNPDATIPRAYFAASQLSSNERVCWSVDGSHSENGSFGRPDWACGQLSRFPIVLLVGWSGLKTKKARSDVESVASSSWCPG